MALQITKYIQSAFTVRYGSDVVAFDFGSESTKEHVEAAGPVRAVMVSHKHPDHFDAAHCGAFGAPVHCPSDTAEAALTTSKTVKPFNIGDRLEFGEIVVEVYPSDHGPNISAPIDNAAFLVTAGGQRVYYLGDMSVPTKAPTGRMAAVLVPVGGSKVFEPTAALEFVKSLGHAGITIPVHYHGRADRAAGDRFKELAAKSLDVRVLNVGESLSV